MSYHTDKLKMGYIIDFEVKFDLEGQCQSPPKTIGILTKVFYIYGLNLVILAEMGHELSRGQTYDWHTDRHTHTQTDAGNDNTRRPKLASGKNTMHQTNNPECTMGLLHSGIWATIPLSAFFNHMKPDLFYMAYVISLYVETNGSNRDKWVILAGPITLKSLSASFPRVPRGMLSTEARAVLPSTGEM